MSKTNNQTEDLLSMRLKSLKNLYNKHKVILNKISGLMLEPLVEQLKEAVKCKTGYFKNENGVYIYIKGIEVTNDTGNLLRMGMNGEDMGVWIHYTLVDKRSINYIDSPIYSFTIPYFSEIAMSKDKMYPITKEDFDAQVKTVTESFCSPYQDAINPKEYLNVIKKKETLLKDLLNLKEKEEK